MNRPAVLGATLTDREVEVLCLVAQGKPTPEIGRECYMAPDTVKTHLARAAVKLGTRSRTASAVAALAAGHLTATYDAAGGLRVTR